MKFSVLQFFSWPDRKTPLGTVYARALDRVKIMDQGGFDAVWLAEHHFSSYSVCPSVHLMGMHIAGLTANLRIGTGVSLAAFYNPLRLAEEVALLDHLSGGRVNWGAGRGFDRVEMEAFGVSADESYPRFRENVDVVLQAWNNERFSYDGKFNQIQDIEVLPKPVQDPLPLWIAASSEAAVMWAASQGHAILMDPHSTHTEIAAKLALHKATLSDEGFTNSLDTPIARLLAIAKTDAEAEQVARAGAAWTVDSYANPKQAGGGPTPELTREQIIERYVKEVIIHGSPEKVTAQLEELAETIPLRYLLASILSHETFMRLAEQVVPRLAK